MVIVEYCCFGNLQNFLLNNRASFVDQINTENDCIDPTISKSEQSLHNGNNQQILNYCQLCQLDSGFSETSFTSSHSDDKLSITTSDLLCWLFQVTMGMKYLTSRKVLHGDLAARNVLLSEGNVVKICDFGLARSLHKCDVYKKQGNVRALTTERKDFLILLFCSRRHYQLNGLPLSACATVYSAHCLTYGPSEL